MKYTRQQHGFLMVEALLATVIITVALVAVAGMFIQSTQATAKAADYTAATAIAQDYLEQIKAGRLAPPYATVSKTLNGVAYTINMAEAVESTIDSRLYRETVTVAWTDKGQNISMQMTTYIVKTLPQFP